MARNVTRNLTLQMGLASLEAKRQLDRQSIFMPTRPDDESPGLPDDPTELDDSELMSLFVQLTRWAEYLSAQLAAAEVDERYADAALEKIKAIKSLENKTEKTVTAAKAHAWTDEDFLEAHGEYQRAHAYRKMVGVAFQNSERNSTLLSRELTRRVNRADREGRVERWSA
jgi:hypothetical protein